MYEKIIFKTKGISHSIILRFIDYVKNIEGCIWGYYTEADYWFSFDHNNNFSDWGSFSFSSHKDDFYKMINDGYRQIGAIELDEFLKKEGY